MKLHELREARGRAVTEMRAIADKAETEKRDLNAEEESRFATLKGEVAALDKKIERAVTLADVERAAPAILHNGVGDGRYEDRARGFSVSKVIAATIPLADRGGIEIDTGFEREISAEVVRRSVGRKFTGIPVPDEIFHTPRAEQRTLLAGSSAADLVPNVHRADLFIDRLRSALVTQRLGATVLDGLIGTIDIPRQTGSSTAQWVDEDGSLTETDADFDDITLAPKTVGALTSFSRRTLLNSSPAIETIVRNDLTRVIASAIDHKAVFGDGTANTPTGVTHVNGVPTISTADGMSWEDLLSFIAVVENSNADEGSLGWLLNPWAKKKLRATPRDADNGGEGFIMEAANALAGYPAVASSAVPGDPSPSPTEFGTMVFGDWSSLLIGYWSGIDLLTNPYETTAYAKGRVLVRAMRDVDVQVRRPQSFVFTADMPTA